MKKLEYGRYNRPTPKEVENWVAEAEALVKKYEWQNRNVYPYSFPMRVTKVLSDVRDYGKCTNSSQIYLLELANGLVNILNAWEKDEQAEKVTVRFKKSGKIKEILVEDLEIFEDLVELI